MKHFYKIFVLGVLALLPLSSFAASTDYYLKIDGVEGESSAPARAGTTTTITTTNAEPQEGATDALLEIKGIDGEAKKGNVEMNWKVEEGEKSPGVEPDEIDVNDDGEEGSANDRLVNAGPKEGWPAGGGVSVAAGDINGWSDDDKRAFMSNVKAWAEVKSEQELKNFAKGILLADDQPAETLSLNYEKIKFTHNVPAKFLGIFNSSLTASTEIATDLKVKVKFPWYGFLFSKSVKAGEFEADITSELTTASTEEVEPAGDTWGYSTTAHVLEIVSSVFKSKDN